MGEWKEYKLSDITTEIGDGLHGTPKYSIDGNCYFINGNNIVNGKLIIKDDTKRISEIEFEMYKKPLCDSTLLLSINGTIGNVGFYNGEKCVLGKSACYLNLKDSVDKRFIYYTFLSNSFQTHLQNIATGTTILNVPLKSLRESVILLPSLEEQKRVASILSSLDDKIDLLYQENKTLEAMAETLFRKWFIEDAKEEWEDGIIADLIDFNPHRKLSKGNKSPFLEMSNLNTSTYCPITWRDREFMSGTKFINGDALLARITPCLENGKTAYVDFLEEGQVGWGSTEFIVMRAKHGLHPFFSYIIAKYQDFRDFAESCMAGSSGRQRVDINNLMNYEIKIPEKKVIDVFNHSINYMVTKMHNNNDEIYSLTQIRNILSFKLMNNE